MPFPGRFPTDTRAVSTFLRSWTRSPPLDGQVGRFWRRDGVIVAAAWTPPPPLGGRQCRFRAGGPLKRGCSWNSPERCRSTRRTEARAGETVRLSGLTPWAEWGIVSFEVLAPGIRRAYRLRTGVGLRRLPPDLLSISDLMLLDGDAEPADFDEMLSVLRGSGEVAAG